MSYINLDQNSQHQKLLELAKCPPTIKGGINNDRKRKYSITNRGLSFQYDKALVNENVLGVFQDLCDEHRVMEQYKAVLGGEKLNVSEGKAITHHKTRKKSEVLLKQIKETQERLVSEGIITLVVVGIGGSELGPKAIFEALVDTYPASLKVEYISNIDPVRTEAILRNLDVKTTAFLMTSKSGTTLEMILNWELIVQWATDRGSSRAELKKNTVAVTTPGSPLTTSDFSEVFLFDESVGGRFATTSACGMVLIGLVFGVNVVETLLEGAAEMDEASKNKECLNNAALMAACIGVWNRTYLGMPNLGIIAYASSLLFFVKHLQQVDCESNGKSVNRYRVPINYATGPMVVYGLGTNAQHAFFQAIHQGPDIMPIEFIGVKNIEASGSEAVQKQMKSMQHHLNTNLRAQALALAEGKNDQDPNKQFPGNRPSVTTWLETQSPRHLGQLLSFYENKVMFQGFLWNLNSFDQEGVQLGKDLAQKLLEDG